jgi:RNA polymerase sigma-32 factor
MAKVVKKKKSASSKEEAKKPTLLKAKLAAKPHSTTAAKKTAVRKVAAEVVEDHDEHEIESAGEMTPVEPEILDDSAAHDLEVSTNSEKALAPVGERGLATTDPLLLYLNEIRKYNVLTREQEQEVAKRYFDTKDPQAAQELVRSNLRFVVKVAAEYSKFGAKMIDLIQEGNVGLMHAVKEFNPYKGVRLITYAVWWIRGYIQEYLMKQFSMVKIGTTPNQRKLFYQLQKQKEELEKMGHVGIEAISAKLGIPIEEVESMQNRLSYRDVSLDKPINEDGSMTLQDMQKGKDEIPADEQIAQAEMIELLKEKIDEIRPHLSDKEKIILEERLLSDEPLTLQEIGEKYKITREAVRQAEVRLMKKIKERMGVLS